MSTSGLVAALLLRHRIYQALTPEERCLLALSQFQDARTVLLRESTAMTVNPIHVNGKANGRG